MKHLIRLFIIALTMIVSCTTVYAQQSTSQSTTSKQRISREQLAEVQARHIAQELAFSNTITAKFVRTYCNCQKEICALGPRSKSSKRGMSEQDNEERIRQRFAMSEKILAIRQKYYKEYSKFLTQAQIERVYELERKMMNRLSQKHRRVNHN